MSTSAFAAFFKTRSEAAQAYANGEFAPLDKLLPTTGQATFHSPRGDTVSGAEPVAKRYRQDAGSFQSGGQSELEVLQIGESGDLAFWTGFQVATVRLKAAAEPAKMRIRVTEVFRREQGQWKLVHRHADTPPGSS